MATRSNLLAKETFLGGNRQKWCAVFVAIGLLVWGEAVYTKKDIKPEAFLEYFSTLGFVYIAGASASSILKINKMQSQPIPPDEEEIRPKTDEEIIKEHEEKRVEDPSYRPVMPDEQHEENWR